MLTAALALAGLVFYILVYTLGLKRRTTQNIVIGGAAGVFSASGRVGRRDGQFKPAGLLPFRDHFCLDSGAFLGFGFAFKRRLRQRWYPDAARRARRTGHGHSNWTVHDCHCDCFAAAVPAKANQRPVSDWRVSSECNFGLAQPAALSGARPSPRLIAVPLFHAISGAAVSVSGGGSNPASISPRRLAMLARMEKAPLFQVEEGVEVAEVSRSVQSARK